MKYFLPDRLKQINNTHIKFQTLNNRQDVL